MPGARSTAAETRVRRAGSTAVLMVAVLLGALVLAASGRTGGGRSTTPPSSARPQVLAAAPVTAPVTAPAVAPTSAPPTAAPPTTGAPRPDGLGPVTLAFAGDTYFEGPLAGVLAADPAEALAPVRAALSDADLTVVNLETAVAEGGRPEDKEYTFRAPATALTALRSAGVDVASMANNHALDFGAEGLAESLGAERFTGFPLIGIGADEGEAYAPHTVEVRGRRVAVLAATQVIDTHLVGSWTATDGRGGVASAKRVPRLADEVRLAAAANDTVVVFLHWGTEEQPCPSGDQRDLAATLADAGADVIVGSHAHRLQGGGFLDNAFVHYGLGNFAFFARDAEAARTGVLRLTVDDGSVVEDRWRPGHIGAGRMPRMLSGREAGDALAHWNGLRACAGLTAERP